MLTGRVDDLVNNRISGWAYNTEAPGEHLVIRVNYGTQIIASGVANVMRPDLPDAGIGDGDHAFQIMVPPNITSFQGLMIVAQSQKSGEIALPIASNDERVLDGLFHTFSKRYEGALIALKDELDELKAGAEERAGTGTFSGDLPADIAERLIRLETRMESAEVFFVRIDEMMRQLVDDKKKRRKRFLGLF